MKTSLKYLITFAVGLAAAFAVALIGGIFSLTETSGICRVLSDACFVPGFLILAVGLLQVASRGGTFDMLAYGFISIFDALRRDVSKRKYKNFYEYRRARQEKKPSSAHLITVGLVFIALAIVFLVLYYKL